MTISAKIVADSVSGERIRLITAQLRYPRFVHAELMTHRVFSRNASSSRAIPVERMIEDIIQDTAMPIHWGKNQPGMQAREENVVPVQTGIDLDGLPVFGTSREAWIAARDEAIVRARAYHRAGYHKQIVNRLLEPFAHINVLVTSTKWANFFALRNHPDAQPEIRVLAEQIKSAVDARKPQFLEFGQYHLPYIAHDDLLAIMEWMKANDIPAVDGRLVQEYAIQVSVARCARVSYLTHDGKKPEVSKDIDLFEKLMVAEPLHASPAEHQATPDYKDEAGIWQNPEKWGNLRGWCQFRKLFPNENVEDELYHD